MFNLTGFSFKEFFKLKGDSVIWAVTFVLFAISILTVYSSSVSLAYKKGDMADTSSLLKHLTWMSLSFVLIFFIHKINYRFFLQNWVTYGFYGLTVVLLGLTLVVGQTTNQASRWLEVGGFQFQPSEFAKLALLMVLAKMLNNLNGPIKPKNGRVTHLTGTTAVKSFQHGVVRLLAPIALTCGLIFTQNLSTAVLIVCVCAILMFLGGVRLKHLLMLAGIGVMAMVMAFSINNVFNGGKGRFKTWENRVTRFIGIGEEAKEEALNSQVKLTKIAVASGGFWGKGIGKSTQRYTLPNGFSDVLYAVICEEYGLWGAMLVLLLYLILFFRLGILVREMGFQYPAYLASGIILMIVVQALLHIMVAVDLGPVTGQTLPLVSWGGTAMVLNAISIGIVQSVFRSHKEYSKRKRDQDAKADTVEAVTG